jgi:hypothetical protein
LGITILIKIRTDTENETEEETAEHLKLTDTPESPKETDYISPHSLTENNIVTQNPDLTSAETTDAPREREEPKCAHYFGYVASGEKIPEECLTCSRLLKCLTSKCGIEEEEET